MALELGAFIQTKAYSAEIMRRAVFAQYARTAANSPGIITGGLIGASDFQIMPPGSGMTVNVSTGEAIVPGNEGGSQGGYYVRGSSTTNLAISTANPTNPRIDTVCLTCGDAQYTLPPGGTSDTLTLQVVTGTATSGATLTNLSGVASLPGSSLLLGYVLVPASATNIVTADIKNVATIVGLQNGGRPARAYKNSTLALGGGYNKITLDGLSFDPGGYFDVATNYRFNVPTSGTYLVAAQVEATFVSAASADLLSVVRHNGADASYGTRVSTSSVYSSNAEASSLSDMISCAAGDYLELWAFIASTNTATLQITTPTARNYLAVTRIA